MMLLRSAQSQDRKNGSKGTTVKAGIPLTSRTLVPRGLGFFFFCLLFVFVFVFTNVCDHSQSSHSVTALVARVQL